MTNHYAVADWLAKRMNCIGNRTIVLYIINDTLLQIV